MFNFLVTIEIVWHMLYLYIGFASGNEARGHSQEICAVNNGQIQDGSIQET